jgi:NADPH:quinone reductase
MLSVLQRAYGNPISVLAVEELPEPSSIAADEILVRVTSAPVHPGDIALIRGAAIGGIQPPIDPQNPRVPGFEGSGVVEKVGSAVSRKSDLIEGTRVAFFPKAGTWCGRVAVNAAFATIVPDKVPDNIAAQMLINSITARMVLRAAHAALPAGLMGAIPFIQTSANSAVGRLITLRAMENGGLPIRLVRSSDAKEKLLKLLPGAPAIATSDSDWKEQVRAAANGAPIHTALDGVGGELLNDVIPMLAHRGVVINYGDVGTGTTDLRYLVSSEVSIRGVSILHWLSDPVELRAEDLAIAIRFAQTAPEQFPISGTYRIQEIAKAIEHVSRPGKIGTVILSF